MTTYRWQPGKERGGDVQKIGETLQSLADCHGSSLTPRIVVDAARPADSPLHPIFEWDDLRAAELFRESQARVVMKTIEVVTSDDDPPARMFAVSVVAAGREVETKFIATTGHSLVFGSSLSAQILEQAMEDIEGFRDKFGRYQELAVVADIAQEELNALMRKQEAMRRIGARQPTPVKVQPFSSPNDGVMTQMQELLAEYDRCYRAKFGEAAPIVNGKDHKLAKQLLSRYDLARLKRWVGLYFTVSDRFIRDSGYPFGVFVSNIGKVIASEKGEPQLSAKTLRNVKGIYGN